MCDVPITAAVCIGSIERFRVFYLCFGRFLALLLIGQKAVVSANKLTSAEF